MAGYLIANLNVHDQRFADYAAQTPELLARFGGRYLVRGGAVDPVEADPAPGRVVVVEFESIERARDFYHSPEYAVLKELRRKTSTGSLFLVEGC